MQNSARCESLGTHDRWLAAECGNRLAREAGSDLSGAHCWLMQRKPASARRKFLIPRTHWLAFDAEGWAAARISSPANVNCPKRRTVAIASNETGTHMPFSSAYCRVI